MMAFICGCYKTVHKYKNIAECPKQVQRRSTPSSSSLQPYTTLHYTTQHYTTLHYTTLHYTTLHYTTLHYTTLHYTTLHCTTLHYTTLHYTTLHYTAPNPNPNPNPTLPRSRALYCVKTKVYLLIGILSVRALTCCLSMLASMAVRMVAGARELTVIPVRACSFPTDLA